MFHKSPGRSPICGLCGKPMPHVSRPGTDRLYVCFTCDFPERKYKDPAVGDPRETGQQKGEG